LELALHLGDFSLGNDNRGEKTSTLGNLVYRHIRVQMLGGNLLPGTKLTLRAVAESLEVSQQPVREAINRLIAEAVLEAASSRVVQVPVLSREALDELWALRIMLEGEVAAAFARNASDEHRAALDKASDDLINLTFKTKSDELVSTYNWVAHMGAGCKYPALVSLAMNIRLRTTPHVAEALDRPDPDARTFFQFSRHIMHELNCAIQARDVSRARHLRCADAATYQRHIYERLGWSAPRNDLGF